MSAKSDTAKDLFHQGFNCAQSVAATFAEHYNIDQPTMLRLATGFGGGIGRMRQTCGAFCALTLLASLEKGFDTAPNNDAKKSCYELVQQLAQDFKAQCGSTICSELLQLSKDHKISATPAERTQKYYQKRPCAEIVATAVRIYENYLNSKQ